VSVSPTLVEVLKRDRAIVAFGLAGVATLSWTYLIYMDWGMRHMDVGMNMVIMPAMQHWTAWDLVLVFLMWAVMMVAMMIPGASPIILLFAEINRRRNKHQRAALIEVLRDRRIAGAALDVFDIEPLPPDHPFRSLDNVLATPHIGYVARELYRTFYGDTVKNIERWLVQQS
jgi:hypothetical protein